MKVKCITWLTSLVLFKAFPVSGVYRCVYNSVDEHKEFYCNNAQHCCQSQCCDDMLNWYYWLPIALAVFLIVSFAICCWKWKKHQYVPGPRHTIAPIHHVYPAHHAPSNSATSAEELPTPYGLPFDPGSYPVCPYATPPPPSFAMCQQQQNNEPPPSYEQLFGDNNHCYTNPVILVANSDDVIGSAGSQNNSDNSSIPGQISVNINDSSVTSSPNVHHHQHRRRSSVTPKCRSTSPSANNSRLRNNDVTDTRVSPAATTSGDNDNNGQSVSRDSVLTLSHSTTAPSSLSSHKLPPLRR